MAMQILRPDVCLHGKSDCTAWNVLQGRFKFYGLEFASKDIKTLRLECVQRGILTLLPAMGTSELPECR